MKKSSKSILYILIILSGFSVIFTNCKENKDPFDNDYPADKWAPKNLLTEVCDSGVWLWWEQAVENIDGFIIERSADSLNWEFLSKKIIDFDQREYLDTTVISGEVIFYRIYAKAGTNISNYCYSDVVIIPLQLPSVITQEITEIDSSSARFTGAVTKDGGKPVTERGVCYATTQSPTIKNEKVIAGSGVGVFTGSASKLNYGTVYYVRAYATNENGTAYGEEKSFKTLPVLGKVKLSDMFIDSTYAIFYGEITSKGGGTISELGFCYSSEENPDIYSNKVVAISYIDTFSYTVNGLVWGNSYHVKAYIINEIGISYSEDHYLRTRCNCDNKIESFIDQRDGHRYSIIKLGNQTWMAENLAYLPTVNSPGYHEETILPKYYVSANQSKKVSEVKTSTNYLRYGVLYNWESAKTACPSGWHLPSDEEWTIMENYLIASGFNYDGTSDNDGDRNTMNKISASLSGTWDWDKSSIAGSPGFNLDLNNKSCFTALPGGGYMNGFGGVTSVAVRGLYYGKNEKGIWWCNSICTADSTWSTSISYNKCSMERYPIAMEDGCSVRCVKD